MKSLKDIRVGDKFVMTREIDQYRPIYYAGASGDFNPIHIDPIFAKNVGLKRNVIHGMCTMALVAHTITSWAGDIRALKKLNVRFSKPVYPEDVITITGEIREIKDKRIIIEINAVNQNNEKVITHGKGEVEIT